MKRQVQSVGVRKWFGDDWLNIQDELFSVLEGFFGSYAQQFILSGCVVNGNDISAGIIGLIDGNGFHLCRFSGVQGTVWPVYCYPSKVVENREYLDLQAKPVTETWEVTTNNVDGGGYFQLKQDGKSARFFDAVQTATRRFVTDAEKASYAGQASSAITTIRDGVSATYDTLAKIATALASLAPKASPALTGAPTAPTPANGTNSTQIATTAFVQAALALIDNSGIIDTLATKLNKNFNNVENQATARTALGLGTLAVLANISHSQVNDSLKTFTVLANGNVDLSAYAGGKITLGANTAFSFTGFQLNKTYLLIITANGFTPSWADGTKHVPVDGNAQFDTASVFYVSLTCIDATPGSEKLLTAIMKGA